MFHQLLRETRPRMVIVDPITNFLRAGTQFEAEAMLLRLIDSLKARGVTAIFTSLTRSAAPREQSEVGISSLIDTWIVVRDVEHGDERRRAVHIVKSRGTAHTNRIHEFRITDHGIDLTGTARDGAAPRAAATVRS